MEFISTLEQYLRYILMNILIKVQLGEICRYDEKNERLVVKIR